MSLDSSTPNQQKLIERLGRLYNSSPRDEEKIKQIKQELFASLKITPPKAKLLNDHNLSAQAKKKALRQAWYIKDLNSLKISSRMRDITTTKNLVETFMRWLSHPDDYFLPIKDWTRFAPDSDSETDRELQHKLLKSVSIDTFAALPDKELQMMFSALTSHQRSDYQQTYWNTLLGKTHYRRDSYQYLEELIDAFASLEPLTLENWEVSWKFLICSQVGMSDKILAYYNTYEPVWNDIYQGVRREVYDTDPEAESSLKNALVSIYKRSIELSRIGDEYDSFYQRHADNKDMDFWIQSSQAIIDELEAWKRSVPDIVNAKHRPSLAHIKNHTNALGVFHGIRNDIRRSIQRDERMIHALSRYL